MEEEKAIIKGLREQLASWENIFQNIKLNSKGKWADATYYELILKENRELKEEIERFKNQNKKK